MAQAAPSNNAIMARQALVKSFKVRGIITAVMSGMTYGMYTAFMTLAMNLGIWEHWNGPESGLSSFTTLFVLAALGAAATDSCSAVWSLLIATFRGKLGDFFRCIKTKPGIIMVCAALIGGPFASTCYVLGIKYAGSIIVPISALCPAVGAILARFLFKQPLTPRMLLGIAICLIASFLIGGTGLFSSDVPDTFFIGLFFGLLAAIGWGLEGCVCGYGTSMIDPEIGITIRQVSSGFTNLCILVPIFSIIGGADALGMIAATFSDPQSTQWFIVAGLGAYFGFMLWYKGNAMCGAALGMSCNGAFSFWGPFFCWIVLGLAFGKEGWNLQPIAWFAAILMIVGIFTIAMNPLDLFKRESSQNKGA